MINRKQAVRKFYNNLIEQEAYLIDGFQYFMPNERIGRVELVTISNWGEYGCEADFDSVEIEPINIICPQEIIEAFERHIWFSQHCLTNIFVFKIPIEGCDTYAIGVSGIAGDGYDNAGNFIEIFDTLGSFLGSASISEGENPQWRNVPIDGDSFYAGAPKWSDRAKSSIDNYKVWSEELAIRTEEDGTITRLIMVAPE